MNEGIDERTEALKGSGGYPDLSGFFPARKVLVSISCQAQAWVQIQEGIGECGLVGTWADNLI